MAINADDQENIHAFRSFTGNQAPSFKPPLPLQRPALGDGNSQMGILEMTRNQNASYQAAGWILPSRKRLRAECDSPPLHFSSLYCVKKIKSKRDGPWFDCVLTVKGSRYELQNMDGKIFHKGLLPGGKVVKTDSILEVGKFKLEIMAEVTSESYNSGSIFSGNSTMSSTGCLETDSICVDEITSGIRKAYQPNVEDDSFVLSYGQDGNAPIVVDPYIASKLRPHQKEGVQFMYDCVMGLRCPGITGCLLADEMGLGKTVQVIALLWTLLAQGPNGLPVVTRAVVVCPSSLVQNWAKEVRKWLGTERIKAIVTEGGKKAIQKLVNFKNDKFCSLLITSYETVRKYPDLVAAAKPGLLICDEAHRLKNSQGNKTIESLHALNCSRRVLLTGTPVQNNLSEFYALIDFANPNFLGPLPEFKAIYSTPIERGRDRNAGTYEKELGQCRAEELHQKTSFCLLRRTSAINTKYLPGKTSYLVFCMPQPFQVLLYELFIKSKHIRDLLRKETPIVHILGAIAALRKLCNHPGLVRPDMKYITKEEFEVHPYFEAVKDMVDFDDAQVALRAGIETDWSQSGKFICLLHLLSAAIECNDKFVVVSNYTQTLDLIQKMCEERKWTFLRLDGGTEISQRHSLVERFNKGIGNEWIFLLSSKAGGTGLNLIGANRIVLVDPDWNPATDFQAMARIWREGQLKPVVVYRLFTTGSIDEKIYQRQIMKTEITAIAIEGQSTFQMGCNNNNNSKGQSFSREELSELLTLQTNTSCDTFDILSRANTDLGEKWKDSCSLQIEDEVLRRVVQTGSITFVYTESVTTDQKVSNGLTCAEDKDDMEISDVI